eukprot:2079023-Pyramimonas_sp.AAC.1
MIFGVFLALCLIDPTHPVPFLQPKSNKVRCAMCLSYLSVVLLYLTAGMLLKAVVGCFVDGNALEDGKEVSYECVHDARKGKYHAVNVTGGVQETRRPPSRYDGGVEMCGDFKLG